MGDLTRDFSRREFACSCGCGRDTIDFKTLELLQELRTWIGTPIAVNSGFRCPTYNQQVGGAKNSQHLYGRAVDFHFPQAEKGHVRFADGSEKPLVWLWEWMDREWGGLVSLGIYDTFIHADTRTDGGKRWDERSG